MIKKAKVYIKYPADAPQGSHVYVGPEGGKYYETEELPKFQREKYEPKIEEKPKREAPKVKDVISSELNEVLNEDTYGKELIQLLESYGKIGTGNADEKEINDSFDVIKRRLPNVIVFYENVLRGTEKHNIGTKEDHQKVLNNLKNNENDFNNAKNKHDKVIAIDNFMGIGHTSGDNVVRRLWGRSSYRGDVASKYLQHLRGGIKTENVKKAKVYVKHASQVPTGKKIERGKRGGFYYQSGEVPKEEQPQHIKPRLSIEDLENLHDDNPKDDGFREKEPKPESKEQLVIFNEVSPELEKDLKEDFDNVIIAPEIPKDYINSIVKAANIDKKFKINWLPLSNDNSFAYTEAHEPTRMYVFSTPTEEVVKFIEDSKILLKNVGYDTTKMTVDNKRIATLVHEEGHLKSFIACKVNGRISTIPQSLEILKEYSNMVDTDMDWLNPGNFSQLLEVIAEDYRQIKGGDQAVFPNKYLYKQDIMFKEKRDERLTLLKKILGE